MKYLSQGEFGVAYLVAMGRPLKQAARQNWITYGGARKRMARVYKKLGVEPGNQVALRKAFQREDI